MSPTRWPRFPLEPLYRQLQLRADLPTGNTGGRNHSDLFFHEAFGQLQEAG